MSNGVVSSACCCSNLEGCPKWMGSSYLATDLGGSYSFSWQRTDSESCRCGQGEPGAGISGLQFSLVYREAAPVLMELKQGCCPPPPNQGLCLCCCYHGIGEVQVSWTLTVTYRGTFCDYCDPPVEETREFTFEGIELVPCCLTVARTAIQTGCNFTITDTAPDAWLHTLSICSFPLAGNIPGEMHYQDLTAPPGSPLPCYFGEYPPYGMVCNGASISYISEYKTLDRLMEDEVGFKGYCTQYENCGANAIPEYYYLTGGLCTTGFGGCLPCTSGISASVGPFSVSLGPEFTEQDKPPFCNIFGGPTYGIMQWPGYNWGEDATAEERFHCDDCGDFVDYGRQCLSVVASTGSSFWRYI